MANVLGSLAAEPWRDLLPLTDAVNIGLKGVTEDWYRRLGGDLETVERSIALAGWRASVSPDIPLHVTRCFPRHRMADRPPTAVATVCRLAEVGGETLRYVYTGNC